MQKQESAFITKKLPLDKDGFTKSFDIHSFNEIEVKQFYDQFGFVIFDNVLSKDQIDLSIDGIWAEIKGMHEDADKNDPTTW